MFTGNPEERDCFVLCGSCYRCYDKGRNEKCSGCSGRRDPLKRIYPDHDDFCDCRNGVLRFRTKKGHLVVRQFLTNPFGGQIKTDAETSDELDWNVWLQERREALGDPSFSPIRFQDGTSADDWLARYRKGQS